MSGEEIRPWGYVLVYCGMRIEDRMFDRSSGIEYNAGKQAVAVIGAFVFAMLLRLLVLLLVLHMMVRVMRHVGRVLWLRQAQ